MSDWEDDPAPASNNSNQTQHNRFNDRNSGYSNSRGNDDRYNSRNSHQSYRNESNRRNNGSDYDNGRERGNRSYGQQQSSYDDNEDSTTIEIDRNKTGVIIGRGGSKIREIQETHNVNVQVDKNLNERGFVSVIIRGRANNVQNAKSYIEGMIQDNSMEYSNRSESQYGRRENNQSRNTNDESTVIEINPNKVGMIIGRGGGKIRELQEKFNVHLRVDRNENENGQATVNIRGEKPNIDKAVSEINNILSERPSLEEIIERGNAEAERKEEYAPIDWQAAARQSVNNF